YLALRDGSPSFQRNFTCSAVLRIHFGGNTFSITGLLPSLADLSRSIHLIYFLVTPYEVSYNPRKSTSWLGLVTSSLAATLEIAVAFFSSRYYAVSVPWICLICAMYPNRCTIRLRIVGFPIRKSSDIMFTYNSPKHIGVSPVLHRLLVPRHSPCALVHLTK